MFRFWHKRGYHATVVHPGTALVPGQPGSGGQQQLLQLERIDAESLSTTWMDYRSMMEGIIEDGSAGDTP